MATVAMGLVDEIRSSIWLAVGTLGLALFLVGVLLNTGLAAGFLVVYGTVIAVLGYGVWGAIFVVRKIH